ncbi:MAG: 30S ribosomal protein S7 [Anaerolineae bacterium]
MSRRNRAELRPIIPDSRYSNETLTRLINRIMQRGKKSVAERIVYSALDIIEGKTKKAPMDTFESAMRNVTPTLEVKPRRVGGATYQVPVEIEPERRGALAMRWLVQAARNRPGRTMAERLASELLDAAANQGNAIKKKEDTHKMAEANRAFAHYRW